jgi:hypothetical protein
MVTGACAPGAGTVAGLGLALMYCADAIGVAQHRAKVNMSFSKFIAQNLHI